MAEFRKSFFLKGGEKSKKSMKSSKEVGLPTAAMFSQIPIFTDSEDMQKQINELTERSKSFETKYTELLENQKKIYTLFLKSNEIEVANFKKTMPYYQKIEISPMAFNLKEKDLIKWNLTNDECIIELSDITIIFQQPKNYQKNKDYVMNDLFIPIHIKIKNINKDDIVIKKFEINLQKSFYI